MCPSPSGNGRPGGDVPHRAGRPAADVDGAGAPLGGDEKITGPDSGLGQVRRGQPQNGVVAGVLVGRGVAVGQVGGGGLWGDEAGGLHTDVAAGRQPRLGQGDDRAARIHSVDPAALLVGADEVATEPAERRRRHGDPALHGRGAGGDGRWPAVAADGEHGGPAAGFGGDQQPVPEPPGGIERDPGQAQPRRQAGEQPGPALRADRDDRRPRPRPDGVGRVVP